jgi:hypothetical protein
MLTGEQLGGSRAGNRVQPQSLSVIAALTA